MSRHVQKSALHSSIGMALGAGLSAAFLFLKYGTAKASCKKATAGCAFIFAAQ
jgi:hypothetical protein